MNRSDSGNSLSAKLLKPNDSNNVIEDQTQPLNPKEERARYGANSQSQPPEEKGSSFFSCFSIFSCCFNGDRAGSYEDIKDISEPSTDNITPPAHGSF